MERIFNAFSESREYRSLVSEVNKKRTRQFPTLVNGLCEGATVAFVASVIRDRVPKNTPALVFMRNEKEVMRMVNSLGAIGLNVRPFFSRDFVLRNVYASHENEHERLGVFFAAAENSCDAIIATPDAAMQYTVPKEKLLETSFNLCFAGNYDISDIVSRLEKGGYTKVEIVDAPGQYARRGDILDIYAPKYDAPVRIEFYDTEIDRMSYFDVISQRRLDDIEMISVSSVREVIASDAQKKELAKMIREYAKKVKNDRSAAELSIEAEALDSGRDLSCIDKYITFVYPEKATLFDYFDEDSLFVTVEMPACLERANAFEWQQSEDVKMLLESKLVIPEFAEYFIFKEDFAATLYEHKNIVTDAFSVSLGADVRLLGIFNFRTKQIVSYAENLDLLCEDIENYYRLSFNMTLACENETSVKNICEMLAERGIRASSADGAQLQVVCLPTVSGFELTDMKCAFLSVCRSGVQAVRQAKRTARSAKIKRSSGEAILSYSELSVGDYVVHINHGVGQYLGLESLVVAGVRKDFVKIKYAGTDMLYLPCNQLETISKYIGAHAADGEVKLSKMGGAEWAKTKTKVKAAAKEMAKELIQLYAARLRRPGYAFAPDDALTREFADSFEYEETDGQLEAIDEVRRDMEQPYPMDRLLCGDVGYGKTEVALRAAFKAVANSKQVAVLVPTTILAMQHYRTFTSRMRGFPIRVEMLSRVVSPKQQEAILRAVKRGEVDVLIGTHRILSGDIEFRDLGLVVVDEEQRFGVVQKEKLKKMVGNVDFLTLTATPIPRTLNMAMSGIRDMSILEEAPGDRMPVQTYVTEYDESIIYEAINKELHRGGQVFYLCNNVERSYPLSARISKQFPDAVVRVAHGQMDKEDLSDIWQTMISGETDILICTTIIETGVDIPNANTLIIEDADKMGLSQLHQIRGRVGRSSRRAYAYFTYHKGKVLTEVASKRLAAIRDFTEFGAGFKVAMRDLEIRGAGNILGAEQHGHMSSVGYELYMRLLNEAVLEEKGEAPKKKVECTVSMGVDAYIPEKYISGSMQRIDAYRKISLINTPDDLYDVADEFIDRYGDMPKVTDNLLRISLIRALGSEAGISKVMAQTRGVTFVPAKMNASAWSTLAAKNNGRILISMGSVPSVLAKPAKNESPLDVAEKMLKEYIQIINENGWNS
ncbi:MAG: transcription-repair coupling factor [Ruminococcaceae bacterium]|nr:transcription-repair coupling factor [Oscillospiraceae bacterium]